MLLSWSSHPARRRPGQGLAVLLLILILAVASGLWSRSIGWGVFAGLVLTLSLESFFFPTHYELAEMGPRIRRTFSRSAREWPQFRRVFEDRHGLTLSPFRGRRWLEPYRALRLLFDGGDPERICELVRGKVSADCEWLGARTTSAPGERDGAVGTGSAAAAGRGAGAVR